MKLDIDSSQDSLSKAFKIEESRYKVLYHLVIKTCFLEEIKLSEAIEKLNEKARNDNEMGAMMAVLVAFSSKSLKEPEYAKKKCFPELPSSKGLKKY